MPQYNRIELEREANKYGFLRDTFEKVLRLERILEFFNTENLLKNHFLLKGGTAVNLIMFEFPRLSVDIDMDFTPNLSREDLLPIREGTADIIKDYMTSEGYTFSPDSYSRHSLDSFYFRYNAAAGNADVIKIELNYSLRSHILPPEVHTPTLILPYESFEISCVNFLEIFAGKITALLNRAAARDLYDVGKMIKSDLISDNTDLLRKSVIFYSSITADEFRKEFNIDIIERKITNKAIRRDLYPVLRKEEREDKAYLDRVIPIVKYFLQSLMSLTDSEHEYLNRFANKEYCPELLFSDEDILTRIKNHPMALWKCRK